MTFEEAKAKRAELYKEATEISGSGGWSLLKMDFVADNMLKGPAIMANMQVIEKALNDFSDSIAQYKERLGD